MIQALPNLVTFAEFVEWKPDGGRCELQDYERLKLPYFVPKQAVLGSACPKNLVRRKI